LFSFKLLWGIPDIAQKNKARPHCDRAFLFDGCRLPRLVEPIVVIREYEFQWVRPKVDLAGLAKLRFIEEWPIERLTGHFGVSQVTIYRELARLRKEQGNG
jgi:hypothetical protein